MGNEKRVTDALDTEVTWDWADLSGVPGITSAWAHSGLVVTSSGELVGFHAGQLVTLDQHGHVRRVVDTELTEGHGITLVREGDRDALWICDPGFVFVCGAGPGDEGLATMFGKGLHQESGPARVVKMTLDGAIVDELLAPPIDPRYPAGPMGAFAPCGSAVDEERFGGNGDVWVADGYGSSLVHRFDKNGRHELTLDGDEGGGRFDCPHAVFINRRADRPAELYIADRSNRRVQVYDLSGKFLRVFGEDFLNSPSGFAKWGGYLVVAELYGRLAVLDDRDAFVGYLGADPDSDAVDGWPARPGWPNAISADGRAEPPLPSRPGRFNSPHSVAVDGEGDLYVSEWLLGGRYSKVTAGH